MRDDEIRSLQRAYESATDPAERRELRRRLARARKQAGRPLPTFRRARRLGRHARALAYRYTSGTQPVWRLVANLGDVNPLDHGGLFVYRDLARLYPPEMEHYDPETRQAWRVILERCTYEDGILSDNEFHPDHEAWFARRLDQVSSSMDVDVQDLIRGLCSRDVLERARAYREVIEYYGWHEFDQEPIRLSRTDAAARYGLLDRRWVDDSDAEDDDFPADYPLGDDL